MLLNSAYQYTFVCNDYYRNDYRLEFTRIYRFTSLKSKRKYIVRVECYESHIFILKFYCKNHENSRNKYRLLTNDYEARKIINTCFNIMYEIYALFPDSSFGFVGANSLGEQQSNTKRYRVYTKFMVTYLGENEFEHYYNQSKSLYLILRKSILEKDKTLLRQIEETLSEYI